ncbi:hypothetical protein PsorP6_001913 [Peronosclerospora sorghi]|uniref:Uncharacterized protein n=1 Tax=Peronosclerospora sorghi TaxID=230839 RepID=A0ACC0WRC2_9STRA|nr:hypothetical protein PsorP6_001913 [Peronosclerospora sorghi]
MVVSQETERQKEIHSVHTQRMQQLQEEFDRVKYQNNKFLQDMATKDATYEETIKLKSGRFETLYNELFSQVTNQNNDLTRENEQLREELDDAAEKVEMYKGKLSLQSFNRRAHDLELKNKKNAELHAQIERLKSPDNERMKDVERIQHERIELEEQNLEFQSQLELIRVEADLRLNEAHQVHIHALEQESAHENTIRLLCEDKEALNRDTIALESEISALEFQVSTAHNEVERLKHRYRSLKPTIWDSSFNLKK